MVGLIWVFQGNNYYWIKEDSLNESGLGNPGQRIKILYSDVIFGIEAIGTWGQDGDTEEDN